MDFNIMEIDSLIFFLIIVWELIWKGFALWKAARLSQKGWYIAILVLNTIGILPIIYIFFVSRNANKS